MFWGQYETQVKTIISALFTIILNVFLCLETLMENNGSFGGKGK